MERNENYFVWLFNQLKGWPMQNYLLFFFALGFQLALLISSKVTSVTLITFIGTILGTLCVLAIKCYQGDQWLAGADLGGLLYLRGFGSEELPVDF